MDIEEKSALGEQAHAEYRAFDTARGNECVHATGTVTKRVIELL